MNYWIQRADFSSTEGHCGDPGALVDAFHAHDWPGELEFEDRLQREGHECCPPGFGVFPDDGRILHLCPRPGGGLECHYTYPHETRVLGLFRAKRSQTVTWSPSMPEAARLIEAFCAGRHDDLLAAARRG
ncbi:MAG: hypothetical protein DWQ36_08270 [Acidobacteria bacterium]|nr:MAG: hypothetical protein DWQ30_01995 [Acidobacteriota bacterium]REK08803.1 MAG: hypothetical protein DWQ36_08270 [Acidobacteriota bacterium]